MDSIFPEGKRYNSFAGYWQRKYGCRLQKLVIDAGFTCPNRDGKVGTGGCTFCDNAAFHPGYSTPDLSISRQLDEGITFHQTRYRRAGGYLAYFQAYSNTYGTIERLRKAYEDALRHPQVVGIVIGTRPDCIDEEKLEYLADLQAGRILSGWKRTLGSTANRDAHAGTDTGTCADANSAAGTYANTEASARADSGVDEQAVRSRDANSQILTAPIVMIEYGIESCNDLTLKHINRGHDFTCARRALELTADYGLPVCGHFILGLPGEDRQMLLDQCSVINSLPLNSVKFHQLQFVRGTVMEAEHDAHPERFLRMQLPEYLEFIADMLEQLRPDLWIERIAGEVPPRFVRQTQWGLVRNFQILRQLDELLEKRDTFQGRLVTSRQCASPKPRLI